MQTGKTMFSSLSKMLSLFDRNFRISGQVVGSRGIAGLKRSIYTENACLLTQLESQGMSDDLVDQL